MTWYLTEWDVQRIPWPVESESVQCVVTSPPYWGLRDYGVEGQLGLEKTPAEYVEKMVAVFREVRRVLRNDGTLWLNMGDCYAGSNMTGGTNSKEHGRRADRMIPSRNTGAVPIGLKAKDLVGIPWRVAFALQADGWWLRSDIVWAKPNPMPESVRDRPTRAHEYVFLLTKSARYFYDADAIARPAAESSLQRINQPSFDSQTGGPKDYRNGGAATHRSSNVANRSHRRTLEHFADKQRGHGRRHDGFNDRWDRMPKDEQVALGANARTVWTIATHPYSEAHFATFPPELARRCILAGSRPGDTILDPFSGAGTVALVADLEGRNSIGLELNPKYVEMAKKRLLAPRTEEAARQRDQEAEGQLSLDPGAMARTKGSE